VKTLSSNVILAEYYLDVNKVTPHYKEDKII
jgi:hypothetical protein